MAVSGQAERYTMTLRNLLFAVIDVAFNTPRVITLLVGGYGYQRGWVSPGQITAALLYVESLSGPLDRLVGEMDRLQVGVRLDEPAAGHRGGARRTALPGQTDLAGRAAPGRGGPALRLPRGARRTPRGVARPPCRRAARHRRALGLGQVDARAAAVRHQRSTHRVGEGRRRRPGRPAAGEPADRGRAGHAGAPRVRRHGARQHHPGARGLLRRGGLRRAVGGGLARLGRAAAGGARHPDRVGQPGADAGPGATDRAGAADHRRPAHPGARRGDLAHRPAHGAHPRGAR